MFIGRSSVLLSDEPDLVDKNTGRLEISGRDFPLMRKRSTMSRFLSRDTKLRIFPNPLYCETHLYIGTKARLSLLRQVQNSYHWALLRLGCPRKKKLNSKISTKKLIGTIFFVDTLVLPLLLYGRRSKVPVLKVLVLALVMSI